MDCTDKGLDSDSGRHSRTDSGTSGRHRRPPVRPARVVAPKETPNQWWSAYTDSGCNPFVACISSAGAVAPRKGCTAAAVPTREPSQRWRTADAVVVPLMAGMMASIGTVAAVPAAAVGRPKGSGRTATGRPAVRCLRAKSSQGQGQPSDS